MDPVGRGSMWRVGYNVEKDYNDMSGYCGGIRHLWEVNGGKCGVCGDAYELDPRPHEPGGQFATGIIVKTYQEGTVFNATIDILANHYGYFELRLCQNDEPMKKVTQECFDQNLLYIYDNNFDDNPLLEAEEKERLNADLVNYKYFLRSKKTGTYNVTAQLPKNLTCNHCVLQWKYHAGNNFGLTDLNLNKGCLGCTDRQEEFYNCADIEILSENDYWVKREFEKLNNMMIELNKVNKTSNYTSNATNDSVTIANTIVTATTASSIDKNTNHTASDDMDEDQKFLKILHSILDILN
jgi:hypothetical protein